MSKIARKTALQFGATAGTNEIAQFGSIRAGAPTYSTDPDVIQALANYAAAWFAAVENNNSPCIEDVNALFYLQSYQQAYLFQAGIPEWDTNTVYYKYSFVTYAGIPYISVTDTNSGRVPSNNSSYWRLANVLSVRDFGALGDGSTDDSAAFQAAINAAATLVGAEVVVPATRNGYIIGAPLSIPSAMKLTGQGGGYAAALTYTGATVGPLLTVTSNAYGTEISGISLNQGASGAATCGIQVNAQNCMFHNLSSKSLYKFTNAIINTYNASGYTYQVSVKNSFFYVTPASFATTGNTHSSTTLNGLASTVGLQNGMYVSGSGIPANTTISGLSGSSCTLSNAATSTLTSTAVTFWAPPTPYGIIFGGGHTQVIDNVMLSGFGVAGILIEQGGATGDVLGCSITNSHAESFENSSASYPGSPNAVGIYANGVMGLNVVGCNFQMNGNGVASAAAQRAITLNACHGAFIAGNQFFRGGEACSDISIASTNAENVLIIGNQFHDQGVSGIEVLATNTTYEVGNNNIQGGTPTLLVDTFNPQARCQHLPGGLVIGSGTLTASIIAAMRKDQNAQTRGLISNLNAGASAYAQWSVSSNADDLTLEADSVAGGAASALTSGAGFTAGFLLQQLGNAPIRLRTNGVDAFKVDGAQILNNLASANESTGSGTASLSTNCPAVTPGAPFKWLKVKTSDGSVGYIPIWK